VKVNQRYDYKDSGTKSLGQIPKHWETVPLKYSLAIPITDGPHSTPDLEDTGVPFLSAEAVKNDRLDFENRRGYISPEDHAEFSKKYKPQLGDVYMVKSGATTGNVARVETSQEFNIWSPLAALRPDLRYVTTDFLFYFMKSKSFFHSVELSWSYGTQQNIGMGVIANLKMPRPPVEEQISIGDYLNSKMAKIDALIDKKKELIERLEQQRIAIITQAITKGLDSNAHLTDSGVEWLGQVPEHWSIPALKMRYKAELGKMLDEKRITGNYLVPYLRNTDVQWDSINYEDLPQMDISEEEHDRYTISESDVLVCEGGEVGRTAVVTTPQEVVGFQKALHRLRPEKDTEVPRFLFYTLFWAANTGVFDVEGSSTISHLTGEQLRRYRFPQPPRLEQMAITDYLDGETEKIDRLIKRVEIAINQLTEYRTALITAATTGKIDVRNFTLGEVK